MEPLYFLQAVHCGFCGDLPYWWVKNGTGYSPNLDNAEQMTAAQVKAIIRGTRGSHKWKRWPVKTVLKAAFRVVSFESLPHRKSRKKHAETSGC